MWPRLPAAGIRTGWDSAEDILQRPWDFPCGSNPQPPRTLACMKGRVLEDAQEETGKALSLHPFAHWRNPVGSVDGRVTGLADFCACAVLNPFQRCTGAFPVLEPSTHGSNCRMFLLCSGVCHIHTCQPCVLMYLECSAWAGVTQR